MYGETQVKADLVRHLCMVHCGNLSLLVSELPVPSLATRVDLVAIAADDIHAFEIKSELDNLSRLERQAASLQRCFEKVTVVVAEQHLNAARSLVEKVVGLSVVANRKIEVVREATRRRPDKVAIAKALSKQSLKFLMRKKSATADIPSREVLEYYSSMLPLGRLRLQYKAELIRRYEKAFLRCKSAISDGQFDEQPCLALSSKFEQRRRAIAFSEYKCRSIATWNSLASRISYDQSIQSSSSDPNAAA